MSKIALCIPIEARRAGLIDRLLPCWEAIDMLGHDAMYVLGADDAESDQVGRFRAGSRPVATAGAIGTREPLTGAHWNCEALARIGETRERIRVAALDAGADLLWWIDSDTDPGPFALSQPTKTLDELTPRTGVVANYPTRMQGLMLRYKRNFRESPARPGVSVMTRVAGNLGLGCALFPASVMERCSWRDHREMCRRHESVNGYHEDDFIASEIIRHVGPLAVADILRVRHFMGDGSCWRVATSEQMDRTIVAMDARHTDIREQIAVYADRPEPVTITWEDGRFVQVSADEPVRVDREFGRIMMGKSDLLARCKPEPSMPHLADHVSYGPGPNNVICGAPTVAT